MSVLSESIDKVHEQLLSEENLKVSDLPIKIQKRVKGWNILYSRLDKNSSDEEKEIKQAEKMQRSLQSQSVEIADLIQTFVEQDFEDPKDAKRIEEERLAKEKADKELEDKKKAEKSSGVIEKTPEQLEEERLAKEKSDKELEDKKVKTPEELETEKVAKEKNDKPKVFGNLVMEKKILIKIKENGNGRIHKKDIKEIIGKYPSQPEQKINNITLRYKYLSPYYSVK